MSQTAVLAHSDRGGCAPSINGAQPRRLQRSGRKGTPPPAGSIWVGRPTIFGNAFARPNIGHARSVILYRAWLGGDVTYRMLLTLRFGEHEIAGLGRWRPMVLARIPTLAGRDLCCWCPLTSAWCHADVLLQAANR